jgi:hypothetical protein
VLFGSSPHRDIKSFSPKQGLFGSLIWPIQSSRNEGVCAGSKPWPPEAWHPSLSPSCSFAGEQAQASLLEDRHVEQSQAVVPAEIRDTCEPCWGQQSHWHHSHPQTLSKLCKAQFRSTQLTRQLQTHEQN